MKSGMRLRRLSRVREKKREDKQLDAIITFEVYYENTRFDHHMYEKISKVFLDNHIRLWNYAQEKADTFMREFNVKLPEWQPKRSWDAVKKIMLEIPPIIKKTESNETK